MLTTNHHKRPLAEEEKHLRFAHFRRANRVAFAADAPDSHSRHGSAAEDEAARHAHLCFVAAEVGRITVEIDGAQVQGRLGLPESGRSDFPFHPDPFKDGSLPRPTRPGVTLRYAVDGHPCSAETRVRQDEQDGLWRIDLPRAVHLGTDRVTARHPVRAGWNFVPRSGGHMAMVGHFKVSDLSATGAALLFDDGASGLQPGDHITGELVGPRGERFRVIVEVRNLHEAPDGTIGGVEFQGMGFEPVARLAAVLRGIPKGSTDAPDQG